MSAMASSGGEVGAASYVPAPSTIYSNQDITWKPCLPGNQTERFHCGSIKVPLDWTGVTADTLTIPLARWTANSSYHDAKSIIINPGGPGASGIEALMQGINFEEPSYSDHDISFDPRGVGITVPYSCSDAAPPQIDELVAYYLAATEQGALCAKADVREQGELMGTAFVARDINAIAEALGEDGLIRFHGFSYGTVLGATLAAMFPDKIDRMVLDGNVNPTEFYHGTYEESASGFDPAMDYFFHQCYEEGEDLCPFAKTGYSAEQLKTNFFNILSAAKAESSEIYRNIVIAFEETLAYPGTPGAWYSYAMELLQLHQDVQSVASSGSVKHNSSPIPKADGEVVSYWNHTAISAINCGDWDDIPLTLSDWENLRSSYKNVSELGGPLAFGIASSCSAWQLNSREKYRGPWEDIQTRHPILFVNGPYDPRTPIESARNASAGFVGSKLLVHNGPGHCSGASYSQCTIDAVCKYFTTGEMPDVSVPCELETPPFNSSMTNYKLKASQQSRRLKARGDENMALHDYPPILRQISLENKHLYQTPYNYAAKGSCAPVPVPGGPGPYVPAEDPPVTHHDPSDEENGGDEYSSGKSVVTGNQPPGADVQAEINSFHEMCSKVKDGSWVLKLLCNTVR